jgi:N-acetylglucosamine kinase-like BadF-type ATPase
MTGRIVLAVDGGNSKTDLALVREDGAVLALVRRGLSSPHHIGLDGCVELLGDMVDDARARAGLTDGGRRPAAAGRLLLAGLDLPVEERRLYEAVAGLGWAERLTVGNDTFAVLRAGTERGWGVAVVCGAGINCVGVGPDGRHVRYPALGGISGDWGGGYDVGLAALSAAVRSEDGRGPRTRLERAVPGHYGVGTPGELVEAIHLGRIAERRVLELAPLVFDAAAADAVAAGIVARLATEVLAFVRATLHRLELDGAAVEVLLGGGMFRHPGGDLVAAIEVGLRELGGAIALRAAASPPIVGAALLALDDLGAGRDAQARARRELGAAVDGIVPTSEVTLHG